MIGAQLSVSIWFSMLRALSFFMLCFATGSARADLPPPSPCHRVPDRPCIALVLGGGGARGGAHLGVIQELEQLGVPVDIVVGTSMGSFVGALYAMGREPADIEATLKSTDWNAGYRDRLSRDEMPLRRKDQADHYPIQLGIGISEEGARLPPSVLQGQALTTLLRQVVGGIPRLDSFDNLPISYRAVAADLVNGSAVVLSDGDLLYAIRASMAIPGVVPPIAYGDTLLVDGGIAAQVPVRIARSLGADHVIAVDVGSPGGDIKNINSLAGTADQLSYLLIQANIQADRAALREGDVWLAPELGDITTFSFERMEEAIAAGRKAVQSQRAALASLALADDDYAAWRYARKIAPLPPRTIDRITINNHSRLADELILSRLGLKEGAVYDEATIQSALRRVYGLGTFERVESSVDTIDDQTVLVINAIEKSWGPSYLDFRMQLESDFDVEDSYEFGVAHTMTNLNSQGAEWRNELLFGSRRNLATQLYWPIGIEGWFSEGRLSFGEEVRSARTVEGDTIGDSLRREFRLMISGGLNINDNQRVSLAAVASAGKIKVPVFYTDLYGDKVNFQRYGTRGQWAYDTLDSAALPTRGNKLLLAYEYSRDRVDGIHDESSTIEANWTGAFSIGAHNLRSTVRWGDFLSEDFVLSVFDFELGGFLNLSGYPTDQLSGRHLRYGNLVYTYQLTKNDFGLFSSPLYAGGSLELGNVWDYRSQVDLGDLIFSNSVFVGIDSPIGPVYLGYGHASGGWDSLYFYLGSTF